MYLQAAKQLLSELKVRGGETVATVVRTNQGKTQTNRAGHSSDDQISSHSTSQGKRQRGNLLAAESLHDQISGQVPHAWTSHVRHMGRARSWQHAGDHPCRQSCKTSSLPMTGGQEARGCTQLDPSIIRALLPFAAPAQCLEGPGQTEECKQPK